MRPIGDLAELRHSIAAGSYQPDSQAVAASIVRKLAEVGRMRRALGAPPSSDGEVLEPGRGPQLPVRPA
jgi:hypothetical protein